MMQVHGQIDFYFYLFSVDLFILQRAAVYVTELELAM